MPLVALIVVLLVVWLAVAVIGALLQGLFWLVVVGAGLFLLTAAFGWAQRNSRR
ncbi:hypothetical protein [Blastococcus sp. SYSU D00820]